MGSDSDWPTMQGGSQALDEFDVAYEVRVVSAHRTPEAMLAYAREAAGRGLRVIIAGAGGAAHLPGMVASAHPLPVIGVPVPLKHLDGLDSLLSIVQMPAGIPVATVSDRRRPQRRPARGTDPRRRRCRADLPAGRLSGQPSRPGRGEGRRAAGSPYREPIVSSSASGTGSARCA